jgi:hypothetical protein
MLVCCDATPLLLQRCFVRDASMLAIAETRLRRPFEQVVMRIVAAFPDTASRNSDPWMRSSANNTRKRWCVHTVQVPYSMQGQVRSAYTDPTETPTSPQDDSVSLWVSYS